MNFVACLFQLVNFHKSSVQISNNIEGAMKMIVSFWPKLHQKLARILIKFYMNFVACLVSW